MTKLAGVVNKGPQPGLCGNCRHARRIASDRGSVFIRCELSLVDSNFSKYPGLPVMVCGGYERIEEASERTTPRSRDRERDPGGRSFGQEG